MSKPAENIRSFVNLSHIDRMTAPPPPAQPDLPFPQPAADDVIPGPRISLRYGSAATEICISKQEWRRTDGLPEHRFHYQNRWRSIHDWTDEDCLVGKRAKLKKGPHKGLTGVISWDPDDEGFLAITNEVNGRLHVWCGPKDFMVLPDAVNLNPFEQAIAAHLGASDAPD